jgi:hypothetical protein
MTNRSFGILYCAALLVLNVFPVRAANTVPPKAAENLATSYSSGKIVAATGTSDKVVSEEALGDNSVGSSVASQLDNGVVVLDAQPELEMQPAGEHSTLRLLLISMIIALGISVLSSVLVAFRIGKHVTSAEKEAKMAAAEFMRLRQQIESLHATVHTAAKRSDEAMRPSASTPRVLSPARTDIQPASARGPESQSQPTVLQPRPRESQLPQVARSLLERLTRLLSSPGFRSGDYDAAIAQFGSIYGVQVSPAGQVQLVRPDDDISRRLVAVVLDDEDIAVILPSSRYAKDFSMTYKESLEAGADVKALFECKMDGTATLKIIGVCAGRVDAGMGLHHVERGELAGFVR